MGKRRGGYDGQPLETLDVGSDDSPAGRDRQASRLSKKAVSLILLGVLVATTALIVVVGTRGRSSPSSSSISVRGTLREIGGRGINRPVAGVVTAIASTGASVTVRVGSDGEFAMRLGPGVYRFVGRSPSFEDGKRDCLAGGPVSLALHSAVGVFLGCMVR